jgi:hypothetical protein
MIKRSILDELETRFRLVRTLQKEQPYVQYDFVNYVFCGY